jgi:16S rRNA (cytosine967-C5)-methyltransferase
MNPTQALPLAQLLMLSADALQAVRAGRSTDVALAGVPAEARAGVQALTFSALRCLGTSTELRRLLVPKPPPPWLDALLGVALALLAGPPPRPYAEHTVVDQAVRAARERASPSAAFVNAVLRRFVRERDSLLAQALGRPEARFNHPHWWIGQLRQDWPADWQALLAEANRHPPMTLRVNRRRCSGAEYVQRLAAAGRAAVCLADPAFGGQAVVLAEPCPVAELPGFAAGEVSVQDASAQRAALLLAHDGGLPAGARVLDACAAPGGKTAQLLELADLELLALDSDGARLGRVDETLRRLGLAAQTRQADAAEPGAWWDGRPFDAILLDAPCTASGIVRRHPDIRWLRRASDLPTLAALQARLLDALWPLLKPGGRLLYATCSLFRCEGQTQIDAFLQRQGAGAALLHPASPGHLPTLPDNRADAAEVVHDGFYLALIHKT